MDRVIVARAILAVGGGVERRVRREGRLRRERGGHVWGAGLVSRWRRIVVVAASLRRAAMMRRRHCCGLRRVLRVIGVLRIMRRVLRMWRWHRLRLSPMHRRCWLLSRRALDGMRMRGGRATIIDHLWMRLGWWEA